MIPENLPKDLPKDELLQEAQKVVMTMPGARVHFKATCPQCSERCVFVEANTCYDKMECHTCGKVFPFTEGGFMLLIVLGEPSGKITTKAD